MGVRVELDRHFHAVGIGTELDRGLESLAPDTLDILGLRIGDDALDHVANQRQRHARGIDGDPAPPPLLRHVGGGAAAAGGIKYQVTRISGHEKATLNNLCIGLNNINQVAFTHGIIP
ncbi:hypothetical protein ES703_120436 [subsurface metagenome]